MRMQPVDRALCITAGLLGVGAFFLALRAVSNPRGSHPGWVVSVGIVALLVGLSAASLVTWRGRWR